jgi:hypothetical protein
MKILFNWFLFLLILALVILPFWYWRPITWRLPTLQTMTGTQAIGFGFASAFMWVEVLHLGSRKPFNCLKCMCGWFTMFIALAFHVQFWYFYLPIGLTVGAIYSAIKMRYL